MSATGKRKHRGTGKPRGGKREGSGRPEGSANTLEYGEVRAVKAAGLRVPESATPEQRELADESLGILVDIMRGKVRRAVREEEEGEYLAVPMDLRMRTATHIREEVCGPLKQRVEHSFDGLTDEQLEAKFQALVAKSAPEFPQEAGPTELTVPKEGAGPGLEGDSE